MKSIEVSFPGSSDQFELKTGVLCSNTLVLIQINLLILGMIISRD